MFNEYKDDASVNVCWYYQLAQLKDIKPMGYYAAMILTNIKNDVYNCLNQSKENNKAEITRLRREMREQNKDIDLSQFAVDVDTGLKDEEDTSTQCDSIF